MQDMQSVFRRWQEKYKANILDMGGPLKPGGKILTTSGVTDGPFAGLVGTLLRRGSRARFVVEVRMLNRGVSVDLAAGMFRASMMCHPW